MKTHCRNLLFIAVAIVVTSLVVSTGFTAQKTVIKPTAKVQTKLVIMKQPYNLKICSDLVASLSMTPLLSNNEGIVKIIASVSNGGPGDYKGRFFDGIVSYQAWYPPKTPNQSADTGIVKRKKLASQLNKGGKIKMTTTDKIANFTRWGHFPATNYEKPAFRIYIFLVEPTFTGPSTAGFSSCEDLKQQNSMTTSITIRYMVKAN